VAVEAARGSICDEDSAGRVALRSLLRRANIFRRLDDLTLLEAAEVGRCHVYRRGSRVAELEAGAAGDGSRGVCFAVLRGAVRWYVLSPRGQKITFASQHEGDVCLPLPPEKVSTVPYEIEALEHGTTLCWFPQQYMRDLILEHPACAAEALDTALSWVDDACARLTELVFDQVAERLAHLLARLASTNERHLVRETHDELAWWIGTSRENVTRELNRLRQFGLITYEPYARVLVVPDPQRLAQLQAQAHRDDRPVLRPQAS
jgi:CRP/FNR family transcriptional regulator